MDRALDFRTLRRYNRADAVVRRAVYSEYSAREKIAASMLNLEYHAAVLPIASNRESSNRDYVSKIKEVINVIYGNDKPAILKRIDELKKAWEMVHGIKWDSPEFERFNRDQALAAELLKKRGTS